MIADRWVIRPQHHVGEVVGRVGYGRAVARCGRRLRGGTDEMRRVVDRRRCGERQQRRGEHRPDRPNQEPVRRIAEINLIIMHASPSGAEPPGKISAKPASEKLDRNEPGRSQRAECCDRRIIGGPR